MISRLFLGAGLLLCSVSYGQTFLGTGAGTAGGTGGNNVHIGKNAGSGDTGSYNTIVGSEAGTSTTTNNNNTYLGWGVGKFSTGNSNLFLGWNAGAGTLGSPVNGSNNIFAGNQSGKNATGSGNNFIGSNSGLNSNGDNNIFIGASGVNNLGEHNIALGYHAAETIAGSHNIILGRDAGQGLNTAWGSRNIILGAGTARHGNGNNKLYIGNDQGTLIYGEFRRTADGDIPASVSQLKFNAQKVGIGYDSTGNFGNFPAITFSDAASYRLFVRGGILAYQMRVRIETGWADYVFAKDYKLMSLKDTEKYIADNGHLPNMPSAAEVEADGVELGNIVKLQQEKIEELTLHLIEQDKHIELLKTQNKEIESLKAQMQQLLKKQ